MTYEILSAIAGISLAVLFACLMLAFFRAMSNSCGNRCEELAAFTSPFRKWRCVKDQMPEVAEGEELHCFVSFLGRSGKPVVIDCYFVNKPIPDDEDDCEIWDSDVRPMAIVGWYFMGSHPDYAYYYEPVVGDVTHWQPVLYPAAPEVTK